MIGELKCSFETVSQKPKSNDGEPQDQFVFHKVPENFKGNHIVPLSELEALDKDLHAKELEKYIGREELIEKDIDPLKCKWGDVIFLSPVYPQKIHQELIDVGCVGASGSYFKIPLSKLENKRLALIMSQHYRAAEKNIVSFSPDLVDPYFSDEMTSYLQERRQAGKQPLVHAHLQQVLYKGKIDTQDLEIVEI